VLQEFRYGVIQGMPDIVDDLGRIACVTEDAQYLGGIAYPRELQRLARVEKMAAGGIADRLDNPLSDTFTGKTASDGVRIAVPAKGTRVAGRNVTSLSAIIGAGGHLRIMNAGLGKGFTISRERGLYGRGPGLAGAYVEKDLQECSLPLPITIICRWIISESSPGSRQRTVAT
jgi:hypothetical protein